MNKHLEVHSNKNAKRGERGREGRTDDDVCGVKTDGQEEYQVLLPIELTWTALIITADSAGRVSIFPIQYLDQSKYVSNTAWR